jgi:hypothetical protein
VVDQQTVSFPAGLVLNLDAANYSAVPTNGSTILGSGNYAITVNNANSSMSWASTAGGIFRKTTTNTADFMTFGPDYSSTSQAYSVFMVYRSGSTAGRLLNANSASPDWLMGVWDSPSNIQDIFFNGAFVGANNTAADGTWRFGWFTFNGSNLTSAYVAGSAQPTTTFGTKAGSGGFQGLRLFGRYSNASSSIEVGVYDVGVVQLYNTALTLAQIQSLWSTYRTRFGY